MDFLACVVGVFWLFGRPIVYSSGVVMLNAAFKKDRGIVYIGVLNYVAEVDNVPWFMHTCPQYNIPIPPSSSKTMINPK